MDTLFFNGMFYQGDYKWSPGLLVDRNGLIIKIFLSETEAVSYSSPHIRRIDMRGTWILPGFEDAHTHPAGRARTLLELDLRKQMIGWEEAKSLIQKRIETTPPLINGLSVTVGMKIHGEK